MSGIPQGKGELRSPLQGALAGGGDPASSPLYVFGPFLVLIVTAGVAPTTFGASVWLVVLTIAVVSVMYRLVMRWVTDGSGGTGLSEEEFGGWAGRINASITVIEFSLTFAVSVAALVTFLADRMPELRDHVLGVEGRTVAALAVTALCGVLVNRGPRTVSAVFGPATGAVLVLLWAMVIATLVRRGFHPAGFDLDAFAGDNLEFTLGGYVRILAVMTGVEVFANLVAAYAGPAAERSRKAFQSMTIIMGTTAVAMVIVGPVVLDVADPFDKEVSVFTQTMDALLPGPLAVAGSIAGVAVLLSAAAASALGLQNLAGGMARRNYVPASFGSRNRHGVASLPVWFEVGIVALCFVLLGTEEATYLGVYAAGVFVLLSMTGVAAATRLWRRRAVDGRDVWALGACALAAALTSTATIAIFYERMRDGVWIYFVLVPILYFAFGVVRRWRGAPDAISERLGRLQAHAASTAGWEKELFDPSHQVEPEIEAAVDSLEPTVPGPRGPVVLRPALHVPSGASRGPRQSMVVPLDGSANAERALPAAIGLASRRPLQLPLVLLHALDVGAVDESRATRYLDDVAAVLARHGIQVGVRVESGDPVETILACALELEDALVVMSTHGHTGLRRVVTGSVTAAVVMRTSVPVLTVPPALVARRVRSRRPSG